MNWTEQPATWKQIRYLKRAGYKSDHPLTKAEAAELITKLGGPAQAQQLAPVLEASGVDRSKHEAYELRLAVEKAKEKLKSAGEDNSAASAQLDLALAVSRRQRFWIDTCCDPRQMQAASGQVVDFYRKFGCRFDLPTSKAVQEILAALDSAMPTWERDHPALFYQTLELNFPHLLRRP
jgi:hypothetical protein